MVSKDDEGGERLPNGAPCERFGATGRGGGQAQVLQTRSRRRNHRPACRLVWTRPHVPDNVAGVFDVSSPGPASPELHREPLGVGIALPIAEELPEELASQLEQLQELEQMNLPATWPSG